MQTAASGVNQPLSKHQGGNAHQSPNKSSYQGERNTFLKIFSAQSRNKKDDD